MALVKQIFGALLTLLVLVSICIPMTVNDDVKFDLSALGLWRENFFSQVLFGLKCYFCFIPILVLVLFASKFIGHSLGLVEIDHGLRNFIDLEDPLSIFMVFLSAVITAPLLEEFIFRGLLAPAMARLTGPGMAILVSSLCFASVHVGFLANAITFTLGLLFSLITFYSEKRSIIPAIAAHMMHNLMVLLVFFCSQT